jgi:hypothetical protein
VSAVLLALLAFGADPGPAGRESFLSACKADCVYINQMRATAIEKIEADCAASCSADWDRPRVLAAEDLAAHVEQAVRAEGTLVRPASAGGRWSLKLKSGSPLELAEGRALDARLTRLAEAARPVIAVGLLRPKPAGGYQLERVGTLVTAP